MIEAHKFGQEITSGTEHTTAQRKILEIPPEHEIEKSAEFIEVFRLANEISNLILEENSLPRQDFSEEQIRIVDSDYYRETHKEFPGSYGVYDAPYDAIVLSQEKIKDNGDLLHKILHEMIHAKSPSEVSEDGVEMQLGLAYRENKDDAYMMFGGINEAVIDDMVIKYLDKYKDLVFATSLFAKSDMSAKKPSFPLNIPRGHDFDDSQWLTGYGDKNVFGDSVGYSDARRGLSALITEIAANAKEDPAANRSSIFSVFERAELTGDISLIKNFVDEYLGDGFADWLALEARGSNFNHFSIIRKVGKFHND